MNDVDQFLVTIFSLEHLHAKSELFSSNLRKLTTDSGMGAEKSTCGEEDWCQVST